jgi:hypothetical protein
MTVHTNEAFKMIKVIVDAVDVLSEESEQDEVIQGTIDFGLCLILDLSKDAYNRRQVSQSLVDSFVDFCGEYNSIIDVELQ